MCEHVPTVGSDRSPRINTGHVTAAKQQQEEQEEKQLLGKKAAVLNPFCGYGSVLAVANAYGLDAYGMDISLKCCRIAAAHSASPATLAAGAAQKEAK